MAYRSLDLRNWEPPHIVFIVPPTAFAGQGGWAPEVHEYKGRFYLLTTLYDETKMLAAPHAWQRTFAPGTVVAVSGSPDGPFRMLDEQAPVLPADFMTLDGTLYVDPDGNPWLVYAHEWMQNSTAPWKPCRSRMTFPERAVHPSTSSRRRTHRGSTLHCNRTPDQSPIRPMVPSFSGRVMIIF